MFQGGFGLPSSTRNTGSRNGTLPRELKVQPSFSTSGVGRGAHSMTNSHKPNQRNVTLRQTRSSSKPVDVNKWAVNTTQETSKSAKHSDSSYTDGKENLSNGSTSNHSKHSGKHSKQGALPMDLGVIPVDDFRIAVMRNMTEAMITYLDQGK